MLARICIIVEFPKTDQIVDHATITLEAANQLLVVPIFVKSAKPEFLA
jgi:hypothetical protein